MVVDNDLLVIEGFLKRLNFTSTPFPNFPYDTYYTDFYSLSSSYLFCFPRKTIMEVKFHQVV